MLEFLELNISWIKDVFGIVFTSTATIIGILTYLRAKETILQPIRAEVIKRQAELFANILDFLNSFKIYGNDIDLGFDYQDIVHANFLQTLLDHGFKISDEEQEYLSECFGEGASYNLFNANKLSAPCFFSDFDNKENEKLFEIQKQDILNKEKLAGEGIIQIDIIGKTKEYNDFVAQLSDFSSNPFLPKKMQNIFKKVLNDSEDNLNIYLTKTLKTVMLMYYEKSKVNSKFVIEPYAIYNIFCKSRVEHTEDFNILRNEVRKYLKIDQMP